MGWIQLIVGAITLAREVFKYFREREETKRAAVKKMSEFKQAMKRARVEKNTDDLEKMFASLRLPSNGSNS